MKGLLIAGFRFEEATYVDRTGYVWVLEYQHTSEPASAYWFARREGQKGRYNHWVEGASVSGRDAIIAQIDAWVDKLAPVE